MGNKNVVHLTDNGRNTFDGHDGMSSSTHTHLYKRCQCLDTSFHIVVLSSMGTIQEDFGGDSGGSHHSCNHITTEVGDNSNGSNGLVVLDAICPTKRKIYNEHGVPPFLTKLYTMVDDKTTDSIISWGSSCIAFIISDERRFTSEILPCYFKNNCFDNFFYQLNNYGFKKKESAHLEFEHEYFREGKQHLLKHIKKQNQPPKATNNMSSLGVTVTDLEVLFAKVTHTQKQIKNKIHWFKDDIEKSLREVKSIIQDNSHKLISTFSEGRKRKLIDINYLRIDFLDIEKDFELICDQFVVSQTPIDSFMTLNDLIDKMVWGDKKDICVEGCDGRRVPQFLEKLYDMVEKKGTDSFLSWNPSRDSFIIWDINKFATQVLPMYFSHTNFSSFNTQLNIYGFRKVSWERYEYANEWFQGGRRDLLVNIKRRDKNPLSTRSTIKFSSIEIEMFKDRLKKIQQEQENKIINFSIYEEQMKSLVHEFKESVLNIANIVNKMIVATNQNLENVKKPKVDIEDNIIGNIKGHILNVDESGDNDTVSVDNNYIEAQANLFLDLEIDLEGMGKNMEMDDAWSVEKEMEQYSSLYLGKPSEIEEKFSVDDNSRT